jgi:hypothetical protein
MRKIPEVPVTGATAGWPAGRWRRAGFVTVLVVGVAVSAAACGRGSSGSATPSTTRPGHAVTHGGGTQASHGSGGGNETVGSFSLAFAKCMRANGVSNFPNPNGQGGQLGPGSGIDPSSSQFQAAINGPCRSLAPPAWLSSGPVSKDSGL